MPLFTANEDDKRPACYRLEFKASNGFVLDPENSLFHNRTKAETAEKMLHQTARQRACTGAFSCITPLFRDKDSGMMLPSSTEPRRTSSWGRMP
jgi:hypothetical protein